MSEPIPDSWEQVKEGMSSVFIERGVENVSGWNLHTEKLDIIHVPAWNLHYEVDAGHFTSDGQIQTAVSMFSYGVNRGIEMGKEQARAEIRKALGLPPLLEKQETKS